MKKKKRTTFFRLFAESGLTALIAAAIFIGLFREAILFSIRQNAYTELSRVQNQILTKISQHDNRYDDPFPQIKYSMNHTYFDITLFDSDKVHLASEITDNCHAVSILIDEDNNIVLSSKKNIAAMIQLDKNDKAEGYVCDRDLVNNPQVDELYRIYNELSEKAAWVDVVIDSAYVDKENFIFIPHECKLEKIQIPDEILVESSEIVESREVKIDIADKNYELITFDRNDAKAVPHVYLAGFRGTDETFFNEYISDFDVEKGFHYMNNNIFTTSESSYVWIGDKKYTLYTTFTIDEKSPVIVKFYIKSVVIFLLVGLLIALLWSCYKNTKNKAQYAFEDYQKTLINNLAHDLKTPLTAISGYAENAQHSNELTEISGYLDSISNNVLYMDGIVNRTLELNHLQEIKIKKESVDMIKLAENALEKYSLMLGEKNISIETSGGCSFMADKNTIETAVENLISNAVKYTFENGKISITADKNSFTVTNNISEKTDVKNLTMPFVKGDKSRNEKSSGLGLTIVQNCADINGLKFRISSTENKFIAVIKK